MGKLTFPYVLLVCLSANNALYLAQWNIFGRYRIFVLIAIYVRLSQSFKPLTTAI